MKPFPSVSFSPSLPPPSPLTGKVYLNLQSHLPDGRQVLTFIRPGTDTGTLLKMIKELPWNQNSEQYLPLTRVQVFSAEDESMSLNMFV